MAECCVASEVHGRSPTDDGAAASIENERLPDRRGRTATDGCGRSRRARVDALPDMLIGSRHRDASARAVDLGCARSASSPARHAAIGRRCDLPSGSLRPDAHGEGNIKDRQRTGSTLPFPSSPSERGRLLSRAGGLQTLRVDAVDGGARRVSALFGPRSSPRSSEATDGPVQRGQLGPRLRPRPGEVDRRPVRAGQRAAAAYRRGAAGGRGQGCADPAEPGDRGGPRRRPTRSSTSSGRS